MSDSVVAARNEDEESSPIYKTWLELFFDLVAVVAVAQVAELLRDAAGIGDVAIAAILFYAVWSVWVSVTFYSDALQGASRTRTILIVMFLLGTMAAALPEAADDTLRGNAFIVAYCLARFVTSSSWSRSGKMLLAWPAAQATFGALPWLISIWVPEPWRYALWAIGIVMDIGFSLAVDADTDAFVSRFEDKKASGERMQIKREQRRLAHDEKRTTKDGTRQQRRGRQTAEADRRGGGRQGRMRPIPEIVAVNEEHMTERLGAFFVIILGEAIAQIVLSASAVAHWDMRLFWCVAAGFAVLVAIWWLTLVRVEYGRPLFSPARLSPRLIVPAHFVMLMALTAIASGLGALPGSSGEPFSTTTRWLICMGIGAFGVEAALLMSFGRAGRAGWVRALIGTTVFICGPLAIAVWGEAWTAFAVVMALLGTLAFLVVAVLGDGRHEGGGRSSGRRNRQSRTSDTGRGRTRDTTRDATGERPA